MAEDIPLCIWCNRPCTPKRKCVIAYKSDLVSPLGTQTEVRHDIWHWTCFRAALPLVSDIYFAYRQVKPLIITEWDLLTKKQQGWATAAMKLK